MCVLGRGLRGEDLRALIPLPNSHSATLIGCQLAEWGGGGVGVGKMEPGTSSVDFLPGDGEQVEMGSGLPGGTKVGHGPML